MAEVYIRQGKVRGAPKYIGPELEIGSKISTDFSGLLSQYFRAEKGPDSFTERG